MAANKKMKQTVELNAPLMMQEAKHLMVEGDNLANTITLEVVEGGKPADLTGYSATAYMIREDGQKPFVKGTVEGNVVTVCLNEGFYAVPGRYYLFVRLTHTDGTKCVLLWMTGWINDEGQGDVIDTENVVPDLDDLLAQIDAMEQATAAANAAAESVEGFKAEITEDMNANTAVSSIIPYAVRDLGMGQPETWSTSYRHIVIPVNEGDEIIIRANRTASTFFAFLTSDDAGSTVNIPYVPETVRQSVKPGEWGTFIVPAGAKYLCLNYDTVSGSYYYVPDGLYINGVNAFENTRRSLAKLNQHRVDCEPGNYNFYSDDARYGYHTLAYDNLTNAIKTPYYIACEPGECVKIASSFTLDEKDTDTATIVRVWEYDSACNTLRMTRHDADANQPVYHRIGENTQYIKVGIDASGLANVLNDPHIYITFSVTDKVVQVKNANKPLVNEAIEFNYPVHDGIATSGRLILPPNYTPNGKAVPLLVWCHGSGGYRTIDSGFSDSYLPILRYLRDEGFAVFDCYPWTTKFGEEVTKSTSYRSPFALDICMDAYLAGVEYVCRYWNVDRGNVVVGAKSLGGQMALKLAYQNRQHIKAIAGLCPGLDALSWHAIGYNKYVRALLVQELGLTGDIELFTANKFENASEEGRAFLEANLPQLIQMNPAWYGLVGITAKAKFDQSISGSFYSYKPGVFTFDDVGAVTGFYKSDGTLRNWNDDAGDYVDGSGNAAEAERQGFVRSLPSDAPDAEVPNVYTNDNLSKICPVPFKVWAAEDDTQVPYYKAKEMVNQIQNAGCVAFLRTMPTGTGGHNSVDTSNLSLRTDVTTELGYTHTGIPVAIVEMVEYFKGYIVTER